MTLKVGYQPYGYIPYGREMGVTFPLKLILNEVSKAGFKGIELGNLDELGTPGQCQELLGRYGLKLVSMSLSIGRDVSPLAEVEKKAKFLKAVGGYSLMVVGGFWRPKDGSKPPKGDYQAFFKMVDEVAVRVHGYGIRAGFHNHLNCLVESEEEVDMLFESTRHIGYCPDIGHAVGAGWDPLPSIKRYGPKVCNAHIKDTVVDPKTKKWVRFIELGAGNAGLNIKACLDAMAAHHDGWVVVEQDQTSFNPGWDAIQSYNYLKEIDYVV
jgi:inosose dehydratase